MFVGSEDFQDIDFQNAVFHNVYVLASDFFDLLNDLSGRIVGEEKTSVDFQVQPRYRYQTSFIFSELDNIQRYKFSSLFADQLDEHVPLIKEKDKLVLEWLSWAGQEVSKSGFVEVSAVLERYHQEDLREEKLAEKRKDEKRFFENIEINKLEAEKLARKAILSGAERELVKLDLPARMPE